MVMDSIVPDWAGAVAGIGAVSTLRTGGVSLGPYDDGASGGGLNLGTHVGDRLDDVMQNRMRLNRLLPAAPVWLSQVHGAVVVDAATVATSGVSAALDVPQADASIATRPDLVCVIQTADCLPVLLCDTAGKAVGAAHAGWRGLAGGVLENTVSRMRAAGAADILAWLGPAIGPQQFEVGEDVWHAFVTRDPAARSAFQASHGRPGKYLADIYHLARLVLERLGGIHVTGGNACTVTERSRFYSYRRDGVTGRMASAIWLA